MHHLAVTEGSLTDRRGIAFGLPLDWPGLPKIAFELPLVLLWDWRTYFRSGSGTKTLFPIGLRHSNAPNSEVSSRRCAQSHHHARPSRVAKRRHSHWENTSFTHHYQTVKNAVSSPREHQSHGELATRLSIALRTAN